MQAANQNLTNSECNLGCIYYEGIEVKQDINKAIYFLKRAANKNSCIAQFALAEIHIFINKDINKALYYYKQAQNTLGVLYYQGKLVDRNIKKALYYFNLSANQKFLMALYNLGYIYYDGSYVCRDINLAIKYFSLAAEQNHKKSQYYLGLIFYENKYMIIKARTFFIIINSLFLSDKIVKISQKNVNKMFYEGFGFNVCY